VDTRGVEAPFENVARHVDGAGDKGRLDDAEALVSADELALHDPDSILFQPLRASRARLLWMRGRPRDALELFEEQGRWAEAWGCRNAGWLSWRANAALLYHTLGEPERASALAEQDLEAARAFGAPRPLGIALRTGGLVHGERGIELLSNSVNVLEGQEPRAQLAHSLVELGAALRRTGERRAARAPLRRGLELADDCGMALLARHAHAELAASGARPRRTHATGAAALTPSERRVARLAADGLANREIAQALFLSPKTVEMHLSHAYRKLNIHSRAELGRALGDLRDDERAGVS
jgi:DNA-binding CsgD family transcriptional regulator